MRRKDYNRICLICFFTAMLGIAAALWLKNPCYFAGGLFVSLTLFFVFSFTKNYENSRSFMWLIACLIGYWYLTLVPLLIGVVISIWKHNFIYAFYGLGLGLILFMIVYVSKVSVED